MVSADFFKHGMVFRVRNTQIYFEGVHHFSLLFIDAMVLVKDQVLEFDGDHGIWLIAEG